VLNTYNAVYWLILLVKYGCIAL